MFLKSFVKSESFIVAWLVGMGTVHSAFAAPGGHGDALRLIQSLDESKYYRIEEARLEEVPESDAEISTVPKWIEIEDNSLGSWVDSGPEAPAPVGFSGVDLDTVVNLGKQLWDFIKANKPVVNISVDHANAIPQGVGHWTQLEGWQAPKSRLFRLTLTNLYGMDVVNMTFRLVYTYGGSLRGKGKFLTNVTMIPANVSVAWGYQLNAQTKVLNVTNAGSLRNPIAAAELMLHWSVETTMQHHQGSSSYYLRGDGQFVDLTGGLAGGS